MSTNSPKYYSDLTYDDYLRHPIWGYIDSERDEIMPVEYTEYLEATEGGDNLSIRCTYTLNDGTVVPGVIVVGATSQYLFELEFLLDGRLDYVIVAPEFTRRNISEEFARILAKSEDQIFPILYETPYYFEDGSPLKGEYRPE